MTITYTKQVLVKRGNSSVLSSYTGPLGELTLETDTKRLRVHDGVTVGGTIVMGDANLVPLTTRVEQLEAGQLGNIISGNSAVNFVSTSSGDGNGYSTVEIVPDSTLYSSKQYVVVDPTVPNHIHIRAGGTAGASPANLFLGAERNNVKVSDFYGVTLSNNDFTYTTYTFNLNTDYVLSDWTQDEEGNKWIYIRTTDPFNPLPTNPDLSVAFSKIDQYPENRLVVYNGTNYYTLTSANQSGTLGNPYEFRIKVNEAPPVSPTTVLSISFTVYTLTENALSLTSGDLESYVSGTAYISAGSSVNIVTGTGDLSLVTNDAGSSRNWTFTTTGNIEFPDYSIQRTAWTGKAIISVPLTSKGVVGDKQGMIAVDGLYLYVCKEDYTDGLADIWSRNPLASGNW